MITADDYELAEAALVSANGDTGRATFILRDECGWTISKARMILRMICTAEGRSL